MHKSMPCTVGLDIGDRVSHVFLLNEETGEVLRDRVATSRDKMEAFLAALPPSRVVLEAGTHSPWISRAATRIGHQVLVANPRRLRFIYAGTNKNDRMDAEALSRVGRMDPNLLYPVQHRSEESQQTRSMMKGRELLVQMRTSAINHARGTIKTLSGFRLRPCSSSAFVKRAREALPPEALSTLAPTLETIDFLTRQIHEADKVMEEACRKKHPETEYLMQVSGVGPKVALAFVTTIENPDRFRRSREVGPYLGLIPRRNQSGQSDPQLGITKTGDEMLRRLLVNAAHYILGRFGPDSDLRRWGLSRMAGRHKNKTVIAVARRLSVLLHRLWADRAVYEPLRNANRKREANFPRKRRDVVPD